MADTDCTVNHWSFPVSLYTRNGVAEACLALQDQVGVDVCVLLAALLAARIRQRPLSAAEVAQADQHVQAWRTQVVLPLRAIRRRLKTGPQPAPTDATDALRQSVKACELAAERLQLEALAACLDGLPNAAPADDPTDDPAEASAGQRLANLTQTAYRVLSHFAPDPQDPAALPALQALARQVAAAAQDVPLQHPCHRDG